MLFFCPFAHCPIIGSLYKTARLACSIFLQPLSSLFCCCPRIKLQFLRHYGRRWTVNLGSIVRPPCPVVLIAIQKKGIGGGQLFHAEKNSRCSLMLKLLVHFIMAHLAVYFKNMCYWKKKRNFLSNSKLPLRWFDGCALQVL